MAIETIDNQIASAYFHSLQPDMPGKSADEMKEFFDAMPKKVLIPKINELVDEMNSGNYGKSAYTLAKEAGFEGSEQEWLASLKGDTGEKGAPGITCVDSAADVNEAGIYSVEGELYSAYSGKTWDCDLTVPFYFTGTADILQAISFESRDITQSGAETDYTYTLPGYPLLRLHNTCGDGLGGTYIYLSEDLTAIVVYISDLAECEPWEEMRVDLYAAPIDLSSLIENIYAENGTQSDYCGNYAKISQYFSTTPGSFGLKRIASSAYEIAVQNGFEGTEAQWLLSLKGEKGDKGAKGAKGATGEKGDKGDSGILEAATISDITDAGIYRIKSDYYISRLKTDVAGAQDYGWNGDTSVPFYFKGTENILAGIMFDDDKSSIYGGTSLAGYPLLRWYSSSGDGCGGVWMFLSEDKTKLIFYHSDLVDAIPWEAATVDLYSSPVDIPTITAGCGVSGNTGLTDVCGNFALISQYFLTADVDVSLNTSVVTTKLMDESAALPAVTDSDSGKILQVVGGAWTLTDIEGSAVKSYIDSYINEALGGEY